MIGAMMEELVVTSLNNVTEFFFFYHFLYLYHTISKGSCSFFLLSLNPTSFFHFNNTSVRFLEFVSCWSVYLFAISTYLPIWGNVTPGDLMHSNDQFKSIMVPAMEGPLSCFHGQKKKKKSCLKKDNHKITWYVLFFFWPLIFKM